MGNALQLGYYYRRGLAACLFFLMSILSHAGISFYNINDMFGVSIRETASTCMDDYGFVWVSSKTGIMRLTDDDVRIYQLPYDSPNVQAVRLVYNTPDLYAYTNNGQIFLYNRVFDRFDLLVNIGQQLYDKYFTVNGFLIDGQNRFWMSSSQGLVKYEKGKASVIPNLPAVINIGKYSSTEFFLAGFSGLYLFNTESQKADRKIVEFPENSIMVSKLYYESSKNVIWIGTSVSGLYVYNLNDRVLKNIKTIPRQPVLAMDFINDSTMLAGVDGQGLWEINSNSYSVVNIYKENSDDPNSIRGNGVYDIYRDKTGRVWVCTYSGGVSYFNQKPSFIRQFTHQTRDVNSLVNNDVNDVLEDSKGNLWFATNNGISRRDVASGQWRSFYHNKEEQAQVFLSLCEDVSGNIWAGTYASGVYVFDGTSGREVAHYSGEGENPPFRNIFVFDIIRDKNDNIWIAGMNGDVVCYNHQEGTFTNYGPNPVSVIKEFSSDKMILGCPYGISELNRQSGSVKILANGYLVQDLVVIENRIWMATIGDGLACYNIYSNRVDKYTMEHGLPSNYVNSILYDNGYLWLGTENGICKFNPEDKTVETFAEVGVLSKVSFNRSAYFKRTNGEIIWGTNKGAILFHPDSILQTNPQGKIFIQDVRVLGRSLRTGVGQELDSPVDSMLTLRLKHHHHTLSLEMLPLGMTFGAKFSWILEDIDSEWSRPVNNRSLTYTNLPTGSYQLKIRMYDNSLSQIVDERVINIIKTPPFWETWWFLLIVSTVLLSVFYFSLKYYINLIKQLHSEEKIRFFANTAHDMRTSLTLIKAPIEEISQEQGLSDKGKYYLNLAKEQADRLTNVVTQLMDFQKADIGKEQLALTRIELVSLVQYRIMMFQSVASANKVKLKFSTSVRECFSLVDESMIEKVVDNLISNAIKYSNAGGEVEVTFSIQDHHWKLEVKDYGIGISKEAQKQLFKEFYRGENAVNSKIVGSGIGLLIAKKYITLHEGTIECISQLNSGTSFVVSVPVKETDEEPVEIRIDSRADTVVQQPGELWHEEESDKAFTVLIVEDNDDLRRFLQQTLQSEYNIILASDGEEAWEVVKEAMPDLMVSDVMMPRMDGFELCRLVKSNYETSHIPVVLLTALSDKTEQLRGFGLGADAYLTKPFDTGLLKQRVRSIINNRIAIREKAMKLFVGSDSEPILSNELNDQFVKKALEVVKENISNPDFNKELFASAMNVSASLLYKKIKSLTDQSPSDFIKAIRLTHSVELLKTRKYSITEVGELCGFSTVGYFSTVFKKHFGKSPSEIPEG